MRKITVIERSPINHPITLEVYRHVEERDFVNTVNEISAHYGLRIQLKKVFAVITNEE